MQVDCFPDAPANWERRVIHDVARVNPRYKLKKDKDYPFVEMAAVAERFGGITRFELRRADASGLARFRENDILFGKITPCAENGKVALVENLPDEYGIGSTEFIVLSPREGHYPRFVYALVCATPVHGRAVTRMEGSTGRQRITADTFTKLLCVPLPPADEQRAIAAVLDAVDEAIRRTRATLEKAQKLERWMMQKLLTCGINSKGQIRDPANEQDFKESLAGRIPKEWTVKRLYEVAEVERGRFGHRPRNEPRFYGGSFPFVQTGDIAKGVIKSEAGYSQA